MFYFFITAVTCETFIELGCIRHNVMLKLFHQFSFIKHEAIRVGCSYAVTYIKLIFTLLDNIRCIKATLACIIIACKRVKGEGYCNSFALARFKLLCFIKTAKLTGRLCKACFGRGCIYLHHLFTTVFTVICNRCSNSNLSFSALARYVNSFIGYFKICIG